MKKLLVSVLVAFAMTATIFIQQAGAAGNGIVASATGSGHITVGGERRTFSFEANTASNGTTKGKAQINNRSQDTTYHIDIDCLHIVGNTAYMSGHIRDSSNTGLIGDPGIFAVRDNGQGKNSPPDQITIFTFFFGSPLPTIDCANAAWYVYLNPFTNIEEGNVTVH